jgi:LAO/AO transport system kinase
VRTVASGGDGIAALLASIDRHTGHLHDSGELGERRTERTTAELLALLEEESSRHVLASVTARGGLAALVSSIQQHRQDPYTIAKTIVSEILD